MGQLYNVSLINKYDIWLKEDEINANNWVVMSEEQLEKYLQRPIGKEEEIEGRAVVDYDDIVWKRFL